MNSRAQRWIWAFLLLSAAAAPVAAEVMDKEPTVGDIWVAATLWAAIGFAASYVHPLLGFASWLCALFLGNNAEFAWFEIHGQDIGRAILAEAGPSYIAPAYAAHAVVILGYILGAVCFWRRRRRKHAVDG